MPTKINGSTGIDKIQDGIVSETKLDSVLDTKIDNIKGYNYIINGNFDVWQRDTNQTSLGYASDDRWFNSHVGTTKHHTRKGFTVGEVFPDGTVTPKYYSSHIVNSVVGANNLCQKMHRIESVRTLAGKKATLAFYARADAPKNMAVEFAQRFGSGENASEMLSGIDVQKISLTTTWQRFVVTVDLPLVSGKIIGTDNMDSLQVAFWFDAGSNFNSRTDSLGHQSGTFDIACVSLVEGDVDVKPIPRSYGEELALCQRYYEVLLISRLHGVTYRANGDTRCGTILYATTKRADAVITVNSDNISIIAVGNVGQGANLSGNIGVIVGSKYGFVITQMGNSVNIGGSLGEVFAWGDSTSRYFYADAEL